MSDSDSDALGSIQLPENEASSAAEKKPRKKMVVTDQKRAASSANLAKAREVRAAKKLNKQQQEDEEKTLLKELVAERKAAKATKVGQPEKPIETPTKVKKNYKQLSETDESESESETDSSEGEVEFILSRPSKKTKKPAAKTSKPKRSDIMAQVEALTAQLAELKKKPDAAPVNVYFGQSKPKPKISALGTKASSPWDD